MSLLRCGGLRCFGCAQGKDQAGRPRRPSPDMHRRRLATSHYIPGSSVRCWSSVMYSGEVLIATVSDEEFTLMAKAAKLKILYGEGDVDVQAATSAAFE